MASSVTAVRDSEHPVCRRQRLVPLMLAKRSPERLRQLPRWCFLDQDEQTVPSCRTGENHGRQRRRITLELLGPRNCKRLPSTPSFHVAGCNGERRQTTPTGSRCYFERSRRIVPPNWCSARDREHEQPIRSLPLRRKQRHCARDRHVTRSWRGC